MAKYEIDLLVRGSLSEAESTECIKDIVSLIKPCKNFKEDAWGNKLMAYKIKKETNAYYFIYTFECEDPAILNEFRRLANISDKVIRCLMINIEKSYGYNASVNPKKQATSAIMKKKYNKHQEEWKARKAGAQVSNILDLAAAEEEEDVVENE